MMVGFARTRRRAGEGAEGDRPNSIRHGVPRGPLTFPQASQATPCSSHLSESPAVSFQLRSSSGVSSLMHELTLTIAVRDLVWP